MSDTLSYTLRMPSNLKTFLDAEAKRFGKSTAAFVIEACWAYLEEPGLKASPVPPSKASPPPPVPAVQMNDAMARFMAKLPCAAIVEVEEQDERPMCSYREYDPEAGETYACGLREHVGKIKHTRGAAV